MSEGCSGATADASICGARKAAMAEPAMAEPRDVTRALSAFICAARWEQLPDAVRHEGKRSILNFIATALAGCREDAIEHTLSSLLMFSKGGQATVIGRGERVDALSAAFLNAASGNVF